MGIRSTHFLIGVKCSLLDRIYWIYQISLFCFVPFLPPARLCNRGRCYLTALWRRAYGAESMINFGFRIDI